MVVEVATGELSAGGGRFMDFAPAPVGAEWQNGLKTIAERRFRTHGAEIWICTNWHNRLIRPPSPLPKVTESAAKAALRGRRRYPR